MYNAFTLYPAIDLKNGKCVRLIRGEMDQATHYNADPSAQALKFQKLGFKYLHLVDLNGAFIGESLNTESIKAIRNAIDIPIQLGGGIRTLEDIAGWLELGVNRVVLGTIAAQYPELVKQAAKLYPDQIIVAIDARNGRIAVNGWAEQLDIPAITLAKTYEDCGVAALIVTDINRDGLKKGINLTLTGEIANHVNIPVIASGGIASIDDITALMAHNGHPIAGAILGRALYDGDIDPNAALNLSAPKSG